MDEPSTGLDPVARVDLWSIIEQLRAESAMTVVLTTHLMDEAARCDRAAILHQGKLLACDTPEALCGMIGADVLTLTGREPERLAGRLQAEFGWAASVQDGTVRVEVPRAHEQVARIVEAFPGEILAVTAGRPTLEDVFVRLTGERLGGPWLETAGGRRKRR
jgi:ABC-2 type transport system ATP-binding protein